MNSEEKDRPEGIEGDLSKEKESSEPGDHSTGASSIYDDPYHDESDHLYDDPHADPSGTGTSAGSGSEPVGQGSGGAPADPPPTPPNDEDDDEENMARMSFLEHLEELRTRILRALAGLLVIYVLCIAFSNDLLRLVVEPFTAAAEWVTAKYGVEVEVINIRPLEQFQVQYIKVPIVAAIFLGAPWLMYQAWLFIAPGLYKRERRWAVPFVFTTATLFILGGLFCYFIALRVTLQFLLSVSIDIVKPQISISEYLNTFIILELGLGLVFQLPVLIFFFTLLRLTTPRFLLRNVRYAVLIMFVIAAIITPTGDPITMTLFAGPMILLYFIGIGASWLLVLRREGRSLPWLRILAVVIVFFAIVAAVVAYMYIYRGFRFGSLLP